MRFGGAALAGTVFGFSLWMVTWVSWPLASVWAFLPWLCLAADRLARRPGPLPFAGLTVTVALQFFAGHPESSFHVLIFAVIFWLLRVLAGSDRSPRAIVAKAGWLVGAIVVGTALAGAVVLPFLELLNGSIDASARAAVGASHGSTNYLFGVLLHDYWGRPTRVNLVFPFSAMQERSYYVGALTLMLALAALVLRPTRRRLALAAVAVGSLAVATGVQPFFRVVAALPGFHTAQNARLAVMFVLGAALLAGWGLDELVGPVPAGRRRRALVALCVLVAFVPLLKMVAGGTLAPAQIGPALRSAWGFRDPATGSLGRATVAEIVRLSALLEWSVLAAAALVLLAIRLSGRLRPLTFVTLALALVAIDLFKAGMGWNTAIPTSHAKQPVTAAIRYLEDRRPRRFVALDGPPLSLLTSFPPDVALRYGLYDGRGYDFPIISRYERFWQQNIAASRACDYTQCTGSVASTPRALHALGLLGVDDVLQDPSQKPLRSLPVRIGYAGADARIYVNRDALPRAFLAERQRTIPDDARALAAVSASDFDPRSTVVTDRRLEG